MNAHKLSAARWFGALCALGVVVLFAWLRFGAAWNWLMGWIAAVNVVTLAAYAYDKSAAGRQALRVPERVLHVLALAGGTPAAFAGQALLRHKSRKESFQWTFWLIVLVQAVGVTWFLSAR